MKQIMTMLQAKKWFKVVVLLKQYYQGKNDLYLDHCPLCEIVGLREVRCKLFNPCENCLWHLFEGRLRVEEESDICYSAYNDIMIRRRQRSPGWCEESITRLNRWERRLKRILKKED